MGTDAAEIVETPSCPNPSSFKVHHMMCSELSKFVDRIMRIFPEIEAARPRCSSGIKALCSLNSALDKAKSLLRYCSEASKLYLAIKTDNILSRCQKVKNLLEQGLSQIHSLVPVTLAVQISQIVDDLRAANFVPDKFEEEAGKVILQLLHGGAAGSDSMESAEMRALQTAASRLRITSSKAILIEKRSIRKLLETVSDMDQPKQKILKYLLYLLRKYPNLIIGEQTECINDQNEGALAVNNPSTNVMHAHSVDMESRMESKRNYAQADVIDRARPPEEFKCPISLRLMYDPVVIASGQTFERMWIQRWFDEGNDTCPKTKMKLAHLSLTPNVAMKDLISNWCEKYGITIQDPNMQHCVLHSLEISSTSIASFGSSMNDLRFPVDISNISLGSLDTSYTLDVSRNKTADGSRLKSEQTSDDLQRHQSLSKVSEMVLESLSSLAELDWESQYMMVEDMQNYHLDCISMSSKKFIEPLVKFLGSAHDLNDIRAQRAGLELLLTFLRKNRNDTQYLNDDAYSMLSLFLDSEVTKEVLEVMEVLSDNNSCRSKIAASGALVSLLKILDSHNTDFQYQVIKILSNLSSSSDVCSNLVYLECIPKFVPYLRDTTLARHCIVLLKNLCGNEEARACITETSGCITSIAMLLETDSHEDQEHALAILLALCSQRIEYCHLVMDECEIIPVLFDVSVNGSEKGKAYAFELMRLLRDTNCDNDDGQESLHSDHITSEDANNCCKDQKSRKKLFGVKLPFSRASAPKKKK